MKKKLKFILPLVVLLLLGGVYKVVLAKPPNKVKDKVDGQVPSSSSGGAPPPDGFGPLPQEAVVRDVITDTITDSRADQLVSRKGRNTLKAKILKSLRSRTDVKVNDVLFTDVAVQ